MQKKLNRYIGLVLLVGMLTGLAGSQPALAQCGFDRLAPSLESARKMFLMTNYQCAEAELLVLLRKDDLGNLDKADSHALLAQVYYAKHEDSTNKAIQVRAELVKAFRLVADWQGDLDVSAPAFLALLEEARLLAKEQGPGDQPPPTTSANGLGCPSMTVPLISSAAFLGSGVLFMVSSSSASDKWDEYEADPLRPESMYDDYKSAANMKKIAGGLTVVAGVASAYFWWKYIKDKKACKAAQPRYGVYYKPADDMIVLTYSF